MGERFPGDGPAANGFGRRSLHEWEAHLLFEANIPAPPDMRAPGRWKRSADGVPIPPLPDVTVRPDYFADEVDHVRASLTEEQRAIPQYAAGNHEAWAAYFQHRHAQRLASTKTTRRWCGGTRTARAAACGGAAPAARSTPFSDTSRAATTRR